MEKACYLLVLFTRFCYTIVSSREATLHYHTTYEQADFRMRLVDEVMYFIVRLWHFRKRLSS